MNPLAIVIIVCLIIVIGLLALELFLRERDIELKDAQIADLLDQLRKCKRRK